jgi:hypothetical protein
MRSVRGAVEDWLQLDTGVYVSSDGRWLSSTLVGSEWTGRLNGHDCWRQVALAGSLSRRWRNTPDDPLTLRTAIAGVARSHDGDIVRVVWLELCPTALANQRENGRLGSMRCSHRLLAVYL